MATIDLHDTHDTKGLTMTTSDSTAGGGSARDPLVDPVVSSTVGDSGGDRSSTVEAARGEGQRVAGQVRAGGEQVVGVAREEVAKVASTVGEQGRSLLSQGTSQVGEQVGVQKQRLAEGLMSLSAELDTMASSSQGSSAVSGLVGQAAQRTGDLASWLQDNEPGAVVEQVKAFARRRPGAFVLGAVGVGLLAGRLARGLTAGSSDSQGQGSQGQGAQGWGAPEGSGGYAGPVAPVAPVDPVVPVVPVGVESGYDDATGYPGAVDGPGGADPLGDLGTGRPSFEGPGSR